MPTPQDMAKLRWAGTTKAQRKKIMAAVGAARDPESFAKAARSISPEAARARALKAAATRKRNLRKKSS